MGKSGLSVNISKFPPYLGELTLEQLCYLQRIVSSLPLPDTDWLGHATKAAPSRGSHLYSQARSSEDSTGRVCTADSGAAIFGVVASGSWASDLCISVGLSDTCRTLNSNCANRTAPLLRTWMT